MKTLNVKHKHYTLQDEHSSDFIVFRNEIQTRMKDNLKINYSKYFTVRTIRRKHTIHRVVN